MNSHHRRTQSNLQRVLVLVLAFAGSAGADQGSGWCEPVAPGECLQVTVTGAGNGTDVVLVPGLFGSSYGFRRLVPLLSEAGHRTVVIEPLGVGFSSRPSRADYSLAAQARRIAVVFDRLGIDDAIVVSHAIGTSMSLRLALLEPARVRAVVSIEGGPAEEVATPSFRRAMKLAPLLKLFGAGRVIRGRVRGILKSRSGDPSWVTDAVVDGYAAGPSRDLDATLDAFSRMSKAREPEPLGPRLSLIRCPVRLVLGQAPHEGGPSEGEIEAMRANIARFEVTRVPGAGNFVFEEAPHAVAAIVRDLAASSPDYS